MQNNLNKNHSVLEIKQIFQENFEEKSVYVKINFVQRKFSKNIYFI